MIRSSDVFPAALRRLTSIAVVLMAVSSAGAATFDRDGAYALLNERSAGNRTAFYVYRDADSAFNHGTPYTATAKVHLDSACVDDAVATTGCSSDSNRIDRARGNVLRIAFDALGSLETAALSIEEPERWSVQRTGKGFDLSGATAIAFDVRSPSPQGVDVQFGVGGSRAPFTHVAHGDSFATLTIPLQSLQPPIASLQDVHQVFTVSTDAAHAAGGGVILVDNIRFLPAPDARREAIGFPVAIETFGVVPATRARGTRVPVPIDQAVRNAGTIQDSALTLLALLDRGTAEDKANAEMIAAALHEALHHNPALNALTSAPLASSQSKASIRNGYKAGDLTLLNDEGGAKASEARLAGFTAGPEVCGATSYCNVLDGATGRSAGLAMLAFVSAYEAFGSADHLADAQLLGTWVVNELTDSSGTGYGGYYAGYADQQEPKQLVRMKSVEDNAILFAAFSRLAAAEGYPRAGTTVGRWTGAANVAGDFILRLYDAESGRFYPGTMIGGSDPIFGFIPNGPRAGNDFINTYASVEANTVAVLALASAGRYRGAIDWRKPVQWWNARAVTVSANGTEFTGFGLGPQAAKGPAGISWATTAQAIVAMELVDCMYAGTFQADVAAYRSQLALAQSSAPFTDGRGLVASTLANGDTLSPDEHCLSTAAECVAQRVGLGATAWGIFVERERNPFSPTSRASLCVSSRRRSVR